MIKMDSQETLVLAGQEKGIGKIPGLQSDLLVPPSVDHPWATVEQASGTRRDTAADLNIISVHKATPNCKICFFPFYKILEQKPLSQYYWRLVAWNNM